MSQRSTTRQVGPDYAKLFGIILVVWGHTIRGLMSADILPADDPFWMMVDRGIYLFHMPLFFFLSGLFIQQTLAKTDLLDFFKRNMLLFLIPLVFWSYTQAGIQYFAASNVNIPRSLDYVLLAPFPPKQQFWFLWALFLIACFSAVVLKNTQGKTVLSGIAVMAMLAVSVGQLMQIDGITFKMEGQTFGEAVFFLPYFVMGMWFAAASVIQTGRQFGLYLALFALTVALYLIFYREINAFYYLFSCVAVYLIYQCFSYIGEQIQHQVDKTGATWLNQLHTIMLFIGMNSFIIYLAHIIPEAGIRVVLTKLGIFDPLLHIIAGNLAGLLLPLLLVPINAWLVRYWKSVNYAIPVRRLKHD